MCWRHYAIKWRRKNIGNVRVMTRHQAAWYIAAMLTYHNADTKLKNELLELVKVDNATNNR